VKPEKELQGEIIHILSHPFFKRTFLKKASEMQDISLRFWEGINTKILCPSR